MANICRTMYEFFQSSKLDGSYFLLFCLSIVILMKVNDSRNKWIGTYSLIITLAVVSSPLTVWLLSLVFPTMANYYQLTMLLPIMICVPFASTELIAGNENPRQRAIVGIILGVFISVCGNFGGFFGGNTMTEANHYNEEKQEVVEYIGTLSDDGGLVLADDEILPFITSYGNNIPLLYGEDIMLFNGDLGILDEYDDGIIEIHNLMWTPEQNMEKVAGLVEDYGCDIIVVNRFEGAKVFEGNYILKKQTENYLIFVKRK